MFMMSVLRKKLRIIGWSKQSLQDVKLDYEDVMKNGFLILDFGSQVTMLIARRLRELGYYSEIKPYTESLESILKFNPAGIILSGGPNSVYDSNSPKRNVKELLEIALVLGICYGMQLLAEQLGGQVEPAKNREYGLKEISWMESVNDSIPAKHNVWMSHGDVVTAVPKDSKIFCKTADHISGIKSEKYWAFQFHPEVAHTNYGKEILNAFCVFAGAKADWNPKTTKKYCEELILNTVGANDHVLCALSGGVDSSVVATLLTKTLGADRVHCVFLDNGLLRLNEFENVLSQYKNFGLNVIGLNAENEFLTALYGISDPEQKRKAIGRTFIEVFDSTIQNKLSAVKDKIKFLAQGTLYPDVIESVSSVGGSVTIKSHHNVGGLPAKMNLKLVEPVRHLFKDEVRSLGLELGLPPEMIGRHPFPGPGLAIRIIGAVTKDKLQILKKADDVYISNLRSHNLYNQIWQAFCVLLPVQTVGVMGDGRTYESVLALRAVTSSDGMTADWFDFDSKFLRHVSNEITNQVKGINRIVYDVTSKPPATIEWE